MPIKSLHVLVSFLCLFLGSSSLFAENLYKSPHFLGRAGTGIADVSAPKIDSMLLNPATMALSKRGVNVVSLGASVGKNTMDQIETFINISDTDDPTQLILDNVGQMHHVGIGNLSGVSTEYVAVGFLTNMEVNFGVMKKAEYSGMEAATVDLSANSVLIASGYYKLVDHLYTGVNIKQVLKAYDFEKTVGIMDADEIKNFDKDSELSPLSGTFTDVGILVTSKTEGEEPSLFEPINSIGINFSNILAAKVKDKNSGKALSEQEEFPDVYKRSLDIGYGFEMSTPIVTFKVLIDLVDILANVEKELEKRLRGGTEISLFNVFGVSAGLYHGYISYGAYLDFGLLRADFSSYKEELTPFAGLYAETRYCGRLTVGFGF